MSDKINRVIEFAYKSFVPNAKDREKMDKAAEKAMAIVRQKAIDSKLRVNLNFAGSYAKNTWIRNESDIDIFVSFDSEHSTTLLKKLVPNGFKQEHGTRIYFRGLVNGIKIEIIPLVKFKNINEVENSVDLSILHADYVLGKLNENLRKDVIILKQFCKANKCYGSETYIHGFSGYSLELLLIKYGGIQKLFDSVMYWTPGAFIDIEGAYPDRTQALEAIGARENPLILVDPTNPKRNVCGSLNNDNFARFVFSVKKFFASPSSNFFVERDENREISNTSKKRGTKLFRYSTKIVGPKDKFLSVYNKNLGKLLQELDKNDVLVYESTPIYRDDRVDLMLEIGNLPSTKMRKILGPNVWLDFDNFSKFLEEHKEVYVSGEFAAYDKPYSISNFDTFIRSKLKEFISTKSIVKS